MLWQTFALSPFRGFAVPSRLSAIRLGRSGKSEGANTPKPARGAACLFLLLHNQLVNEPAAKQRFPCVSAESLPVAIVDGLYTMIPQIGPKRLPNGPFCAAQTPVPQRLATIFKKMGDKTSFL
jgi:hypothetical protein